MHEFYASEGPIHIRSSRVRGPGGVGSARCRKICSLKRHVPFDALYIIHKVKAVTVPSLPRRKRWAFDFTTGPDSDNFCRTPAIAISIIVERAHRLYSPASISTFATSAALTTRVRANNLWRNETFVYGTSTLCQCRFSIITLHGRRVK